MSRASATAAQRTAEPRPFRYVRGTLHCDGVSLGRLAREHGTPLYVYSEAHMLARLRLFEQAFAPVAHTVCFAVKSNSSLALLKLLAKHGAGFDIVSGGELARVERAAKGAVGRTVFSGVGKTVAELDAALRAGILMFNVESEAELRTLEARAKKLGVAARFALRVNPDVFAETHPYISTGLSAHKFGIDIRQARRMYRACAGSKHLVAAGISVHIGSQIRAVDPFGAALARVGTLVRQLARDGIALRYIDAGGGLGIEYGEEAFDPAAAVEAYAAQVLAATGGLGLELLLEPGRFLIAQAGALVTEVVVRKRNGNKDFVITDAGMNDLIRPALYQAHHGIWPVRAVSTQGGRLAGAKKVDVVGPVCESGDFFARDRRLAPVQAGDLLAIVDAGAYGMTQASNYNTRPRAAEVLVSGRTSRLIRRRESFREMVAQELP